MIDSPNLYWDTCVFYRYITRQPPVGLTDLDRLVDEAKKRARKIYFSTLTFAEMSPGAIREGYGSFGEFIADMGAAFEPVDPNPNILAGAAILRDARVTNPGGPREKPRVLGTADAIHLATCLYIRDTLEVRDVILQTYDEGKGATWEGRCVPILGLERWYAPADRSGLIGDACSLTRQKPLHPQRDLVGMLADGEA